MYIKARIQINGASSPKPQQVDSTPENYRTVTQLVMKFLLFDLLVSATKIIILGSPIATKMLNFALRPNLNYTDY